MSKMLNCGDVVAGCQHKVEAPTEAELLQKVTVHAREAHGVEEVTPELRALVKSVIQER